MPQSGARESWMNKDNRDWGWSRPAMLPAACSSGCLFSACETSKIAMPLPNRQHTIVLLHACNLQSQTSTVGIPGNVVG